MNLFIASILDSLPVNDHTDILKQLDITGVPNQFPELKENEAVICGSVSTTTPGTEFLVSCASLSSMKETYSRWHVFLGNTLHWYICTDYPELIQRLCKQKDSKASA